jgi:hypothetical protein
MVSETPGEKAWGDDPEPWDQPSYLAGYEAARDSLHRPCMAKAWFEGYEAAEQDAENRPYSDRPEAAEWLPTRNPYVPPVDSEPANAELWRAPSGG